MTRIQMWNPLLDLVVLACAAAAVLLLIAGLYRAATGHPRQHRTWLAFGAVIGLYGALWLGAMMFSRPRVLAEHGRKCFDDWCIEVSSVERSERLLVHVRVVSEAKRVTQRELGADARVIDDRGQAYPARNAADLRRAVGPGEQYPATLCFDVPRTVTHPVLLVRSGPPFSSFLLGDENGPWHGKTVFPL